MIRRGLLIALLLGTASPAQDVVTSIEPPAESTPDALQTGTASIEGTVVSDTGNQPVKKAQVMLLGAMQRGNQPPTAFTDASGAFAFRKLPPGTYTVQATHPAFDQNRSMILGDNQQEITVTADQHVTSVTLRLTPYGAITGHLIDEYGDPALNCQVFAVPAGHRPGSQMTRMYPGRTDDRGEYRIADIAAGRYSVYERCPGTLAAPHGFMERGDPRTPELVFVPEFYGGTAGAKGASTVTVTPGAEVQGIDFRLKTANAIVLRIVVRSDLAFDPENLTVGLTADGFESMTWGASWDEKSGAFLVRGLVPGAYAVHAMSQDQDSPAFGAAEATVSEANAKPVSLELLPPMTLTGTVQFEGDQKLTIPPGASAPAAEMNQPREIVLVGLESWYSHSQPRAQVNKDGTFTLTGVTPGKWMVQAQGVAGSIRSATLGQHDISPYAFEIGPGATGPLNITVSTKETPVNVSISGADSGRAISVIAVPKGSDDAQFQFGVPSTETQGASAQLNLMPGKYTVYAVEGSQPWPVMADEALRAAIADRGKPLEVKDDASNASVSVDLVTRDDLRSALQRESQ